MNNLEKEQNIDSILTGLFSSHQSAAIAYEDLLHKGYKPEDIHLFMTDETRNKYFANIDQSTAVEDNTKTLQGTVAGTVVGGALGAIAAAVLAAGTSVIIPGLGIVVSGPLMAAMAGGGAGAFAGGFVGGLIGSGIPKENAEAYEAGIKSGGIVIGIKPKSEEEANIIEDKWKSLKIENFYRS